MKKKKLRKKIKRIAEGIEQGKQIEDPREAIYVQIDFLKKNIEKLKHVKNDPDTQFAYGEKTAYLDCYDFFEIYRDAEEYGWDPSLTDGNSHWKRKRDLYSPPRRVSRPSFRAPEKMKKL